MTGSLIRLLSADRIVLPVAEEVAMHMGPVRQAITCDRPSATPAANDGLRDEDASSSSDSISSRRRATGLGDDHDVPVIAVDANSQGVAKAIQFCERQVEMEKERSAGAPPVNGSAHIEDVNGRDAGGVQGKVEGAEWEEDFMEKVDGDALMEIFKAAKALGIQPLVNLACRRVQCMMDELAPLEQEGV